MKDEQPTRVDRPQASTPRPDREQTAPASAFDPPATRFEAIGELGRGGMGRVDDAFDHALGRQVAIKHVLSTDSEDLARFEREARITARLEHPGIVPIHDAGRTADGTPFYVMRRVDGRPLDQLVANKSLEERLALVPNVLAACDAAGYAHARGVIHRDIKPSNILVGPFGETLLIDWGLAREVVESGGSATSIPIHDTSLTRAGTIAGTPGFMAPEQARGETVDARADVFALGATLFHVLAGRSPYGAASATQIIDDVGNGRAPDWRLVPRGVPADLRAILMKSMAVEPGDRYADAGELSADLRRFVAGNLVGAYRYGRLEQLRRFVRRHRAPIAAGLIGLAVAIATAVVLIGRVIDERDAADLAREQAEARGREAADARDDLLVQHAQQLASSDPIAAIAALRDLPLASAKWPQAWAAATTAYFHGVPSGTTVGSAAVSSLEVSPDNLHAMVVSHDGGVYLIDLAARTRELVEAAPGMAWCTYFAHGRRLVCRGRLTGVIVIDTSTKTIENVELAATVSTTDTDHEDAVYLRVSTGGLYRLHGTRADKIGDNVEELKVVPGSDRIIVRTTTAIEVWSPDHRWPLGPQAASLGVATDRGRIAVAFPDRVEVWDVRGEPAKLRSLPSDGDTPLGMRDDKVYVFGVPQPAHPAGSDLIRLEPSTYEPKDDAVLFSWRDGRIAVIDDNGWFEIASPQMHYSRMAMSLDHRYVVIATESGLVLWWDLPQFRPRSEPFTPGLNLVRLGKHGLWTFDFTSLYRRDRATGAVDSIDNPGSLDAYVDVDERFAVFYSPDGHRVVDLATHSIVYEMDRTARVWSANTNRLALGRDDGTVDLLDADEWKWRTLGKLPFTPDGIASYKDAVVSYAGPRACWVGGACSTFAAPIEAIGLPTLDRAWLVVAGDVWRWDRGGAPVAVDTGHHLTGLITLRDVEVAFSTTSIAVLGDPVLVFPTPPMQRLSSGVSRLVFVAPNGDIVLVDPHTGGMAHLPAPNVLKVASDDDTVFATTYGGHAFSWRIDVPTDPALLQKWLDGVTNARKLAGGIVSFP